MVDCFPGNLYNKLNIISFLCDTAILDACLMSFLSICASGRVLTFWVTWRMRIVYIPTMIFPCGIVILRGWSVDSLAIYVIGYFLRFVLINTFTLNILNISPQHPISSITGNSQGPTLHRVCMPDYICNVTWWYSTGYLLTFYHFYQSIEACLRCSLPLDFDKTNVV